MVVRVKFLVDVRALSRKSALKSMTVQPAASSGTGVFGGDPVGQRKKDDVGLLRPIPSRPVR